MYIKFQAIGEFFWGEGDSIREALRNAEKQVGGGRKIKQKDTVLIKMYISKLPFYEGSWQDADTDVPETHAAIGVNSYGEQYWLRCERINLTASPKEMLEHMKDAVSELCS